MASLFRGKKPSKNAPVIHRVKIRTSPSPTPLQSATSKSNSQRGQTSNDPRPRSTSLPAVTLAPSAADSSKSNKRKRLNSRNPSPALQQRIDFDSDDDNEEAALDFSDKRQRLPAPENVDRKRRLVAKSPFSRTDEAVLIHAVTRHKKGLPLALDLVGIEDSIVFLNYPGAPFRERYSLPKLKYPKGEFNPAKEIMQIIKEFAQFYLTPEEAEQFLNQEWGILRRLERARNINDFSGFKTALESYNSVVNKLRADGTLTKKLRQEHVIPFELVKRILKQSYFRTVSPNLLKLKKYENGSSEVYGELKHGFIFEILTETKLTSDQVFVDLGSGVGNVVLQSALQIGCESWGCEILPDPCDLAEAQQIEFNARCRLWGLAPGPVKLERGDFMKNDNILKALKRADVVLVNNEVFRPELNNSLVNLFLDLKDGCKIVSLKSFVPQNHNSQLRVNDIVNLLDVEPREYGAKSVSWKNEGGNYFIATKDSKRLQFL